MLGKRLAIFISIVYGVLLAFYTLAFAFGEIPCPKSEDGNCVNFCCGDDNGECDTDEIRQKFVDRHNYSTVFDQLNGNYTITSLNTYRCRLEEKTYFGNFSDKVYWQEKGHVRFSNRAFERFCLKEVEFAHNNDPSSDWKMINCETDMDMLEKISIGFCVVVILIIVICIAVKKQLRISNYGQNVIGIVLTCINIFTSRTIQENTRFFVFIHALGFIMVPLWLVSQAFEVWYPLKFFGKTKETICRNILHNIFTHVGFAVLFFGFFYGYVFQNTIDAGDFVRSDIADYLKFGTFVVIIIFIVVMFSLHSLCVHMYWSNEKNYKDIDYDRIMLLGERLTANIVTTVVILILFTMSCINYGEFTVQNSNIRLMEYIRFVTEMFSVLVFFTMYVVCQLQKEGEYVLRIDTAIPEPTPMYDDDEMQMTKKNPNEKK